MSIAKPHLPSLSIFIALLMISVARTSSSIEAFEFVDHFLGAKKGDMIEGLDHVRQYLIKYGYINSGNSNFRRDDFDDILAQGIKKYQIFNHLDSSGVLDSKTLAQMAMPRCNMPDFINGTSVPHGMKVVLNMSNGSYYTLGSRWNTFNLTFAFRPGTRADALPPIEAAFAMWESVSMFQFIRSGNFYTSNLKLSFHSGDHGDGNPFIERRGSHLAHATMPPRGILHFNADEPWVDGAVRGGVDIGTVALHEIGHLLGLEHSKVKSAIMWPYVPNGKIKGLDPDDIAGIKALYQY